MSDRDSRERQAAKTTIVGGQPPGNQRVMPSVPVGIEELLSMAAADPAFADLLLDRRDDAMAASGVALTGTERQIIDAVDRRALQQMIANVDRALPAPERRAFLGRAAAALLAVVGAGVGSAASGCAKRSPDAARPTSSPVPPRPAPPAATPAVDQRAATPQPEVPIAGATIAKPDAAAISKGVPIGGLVADPRRKPDAAAARPPGPIGEDRPRPTRGIRPDRPPVERLRPTKGIRPDRRIDLADPFERKKR